jgi:transposase
MPACHNPHSSQVVEGGAYGHNHGTPPNHCTARLQGHGTPAPARRPHVRARRLPSRGRHRLDTSRQNAHRWYRRWQQGGRDALRAAGRAGRKPKLDPRQRRKLERALLQGAQAHGFDTDLWTLQRIAVVTERLTGVRHHPSHVWRILRAMGWSVQRPARRASERDEEAIARWVAHDWPRIRQKRAPAGRVDRGA